MTYEYAQSLSHLVASVLFVCVLLGVVIYAFKPSNKEAFERASRLPLDSDNPQQKR
jgi:cbb3-type cytochrome oxidase subunit 3